MLGVSRPIYVNVDSPNLGFPYFNFLGGVPVKNHPVCSKVDKEVWKSWEDDISVDQGTFRLSSVTHPPHAPSRPPFVNFISPLFYERLLPFK